MDFLSWITHMAHIPGSDVKVVKSFKNRVFRSLWNCAAKMNALKTTLEIRLVALLFMISCGAYSESYVIQQVRVRCIRCIAEVSL